MQCYWFVNNREAKNANHLAWKFIQHFFIHLFLLTLCTHNSRSHGWLNMFIACKQLLAHTWHDNSLSLPFNLNKTRLSSYLNNADPNHIIVSLWRDFCDRKNCPKKKIFYIFFCVPPLHMHATHHITEWVWALSKPNSKTAVEAAQKILCTINNMSEWESEWVSGCCCCIISSTSSFCVYFLYIE